MRYFDYNFGITAFWHPLCREVKYLQYILICICMNTVISCTGCNALKPKYLEIDAP